MNEGDVKVKKEAYVVEVKEEVVVKEEPRKASAFEREVGRREFSADDKSRVKEGR